MSDKTGIEWTDATWNPLVGCTKVSPGCDHCYAKTMHERFNGKGSFDTVQLAPQRLDQPLRWRRPRRVFVNSMSDLFHRDVADDYIAQVFAVMALAPRHTFQLLTKRHGRMRSLLSSRPFHRLVERAYDNLLPQAVREVRDHAARLEALWLGRPYAWPLPNVWLGVSVETQQWADARVPALLDTPAAVRWLSCEPLLGPVDLSPALTGRCWHCKGTGALPGSNSSSAQKSGPPSCYRCNGTGDARYRLDWVVVGGESGHGARPMHPDWSRTLRDQCEAAGVPFLFKQWGEFVPGFDGGHSSHVEMVRVGKKAAGRELDGVTHDGYPERARP